MSHVAVMIPCIDRIAGAEQQALLLAKGLRARDWRVSMVALTGSGGEAAAELRKIGVEFVSLKMRHGLADPGGWIRFHSWLRREQPDVLHAHLPHAAWMARWSRIASSVPVVIDTIHNWNTGTMGGQMGYALSRRLPDRVTAVSRSAAASHLAAGMVREEGLSVLPNGIDMDAWGADPKVRADTRREIGLRDEFLWLAAGRLETVKDYPTLLRAMARVGETAQLVILGDGRLRAELMQMPSQLGLAHRVHFRGFEADVRRWMQAADGFVLASRYEGLPMVLLEAAACGLPVVATNVPGTRDVVVNGETGWLACISGADALAAVLARMMRMPVEERRAMGERARRFVGERFNLKNVLDQWEQLYAELLDRSARRATHLRAREALTGENATSA